MSSGSCFSSVFLLPQFFLWMWVAALFFNSPSALVWVFALQLLVERSITFDFTTVYQSLYTGFSWFCSFHSVTVPGDFLSSHRISPFHCSFPHSSIPSPTYTTIGSAIPQLKGIPSFSDFLLPQRERLWIFLYRLFYLWPFWGISPAVVWLGRRADILLWYFEYNSKLPSRMVGSIHNSTSSALVFQFYHILSNIPHFPLLSS